MKSEIDHYSTDFPVYNITVENKDEKVYQSLSNDKTNEQEFEMNSKILVGSDELKAFASKCNRIEIFKSLY